MEAGFEVLDFPDDSELTVDLPLAIGHPPILDPLKRSQRAGFTMVTGGTGTQSSISSTSEEDSSTGSVVITAAEEREEGGEEEPTPSVSKPPLVGEEPSQPVLIRPAVASPAELSNPNTSTFSSVASSSAGSRDYVHLYEEKEGGGETRHYVLVDRVMIPVEHSMSPSQHEFAGEPITVGSDWTFGRVNLVSD